MKGFNNSIGSLAGTGGTVTNSNAGAATLTAGGNNASTSFAGVIGNGAGTLALAKTGTGTLTLGGQNTYTGATTITEGTLALSGAGSIAASSGVTESGSGALDISGISPDGTTIASLSGSSTALIYGQRKPNFDWRWQARIDGKPQLYRYDDGQQRHSGSVRKRLDCDNVRFGCRR